MNIYFGTLVWGKEYTRIFTDYVLPTVFNNTNIPSVFNIGKKYYEIFSTDDDIDAIKRSPIFKKIQHDCEVNFVAWAKSGNPEKEITGIFHVMLKEAFKKNAVFRMIPPDVIPSDYSYPRAWRYITEGKKAVALPMGAFRVTKDFLNCLFFGGSHFVPAHELIFYAMEYLHHETKSHFLDSKTFHPYPAQIIRKTVDGFFVNSFINQPLFIKMDSLDFIEKYHHPEYDLVWEVVDCESDVKLIKSPTEIFEVSITPDYPQSHMWPANEFSSMKVSEFIRPKIYTGGMLRNFINGYSTSPEYGPSLNAREILNRVQMEG